MDTENDQQQDEKKSSGCGGWVIGMLLLSFVLAGLFPHVFQGHHKRFLRCGSNLLQMSQFLNWYADDHEGEFPPLSEERGNLMPQKLLIFPEYLVDELALLCPSAEYGKGADYNDDYVDESYIDDRSYIYLSHIITSEVEGLAYVEAYRRAAKEENGFDHDFTTPAGDVIARIRLSDSLTKESPEAAKIPVMVERVGHHRGANVLFLDGHVELMELDSGFPMTTKFLDALESIDE